MPAELQLFRPANTYGDSQLPQPPMRLRSREQAEKDRVYGYPPRLGQRNLPRNTCPFEIEDLSGSVSFSRLQQLAQQRKIEVDDSMTSEKVRELIQEHDADYFRRRSGHPPLKLRIGNHSSQKLPASPASSETSRKRRRQEPEAEAEEGGQKSDSKKRRKSETNTEEDGSASKLQRIRLVLNKSRKNDPNRKG